MNRTTRRHMGSLMEAEERAITRPSKKHGTAQ